MDNSIEESLYKFIKSEDHEAVKNTILKGANPNKITSHGKTCLGEAANIGNLNIVKLLLESVSPSHTITKRSLKSQKRKLKHSNDRNVKSKNSSDGHSQDIPGVYSQNTSNINVNQGYYVFIHSEVSSSDENKIYSLKSGTPTSLPSTPSADLEWDENIGNIAPSTKEDETWTSMYKWYASILENTGAAIALASNTTNGIDQQDTFTRTALHYASEKGHIGIVKLLINSGCKIDVAADDGFTPLHIATMKNHTEVVKFLLAAGSNVNYKTHEKMTPLHLAASRGYVDLVKILVNNGSNMEARDTNERTALYLAAGHNHADLVEYLVTRGANVNGEDIHGYTPLCEAVWLQHLSVVQMLLSVGARITHSHKLLHFAIIQQQEDMVRMIANAGGGINLHNDNGDTPLLLAVRMSQPNIARLLLDRGAIASSCNSITGSSAIHIAVEFIDCPRQFQELLMDLIHHKIDMNYVSLTGDTALNRALLLQKDHAAVLLIRHGANVNTCDSTYGFNNLLLASRKRLPQLASMLLKAGHKYPLIDSKATPKHGTTNFLVHSLCKQTLSLFDICRIRIRNLCKVQPLYSFVKSLPLPRSLKPLLMLEDEGSLDISCIYNDEINKLYNGQ